MSLVYCPECGHEISQNAIACPSCGRPISAAPPVVEEVVRPAPAAVVTHTRREGLPPWVLPVAGVLGLLLLVVLFFLLRGGSSDSNVNLAVNTRRPTEMNRDARTTSVPPSEPSTQTVPGSQVSVPSTTTSDPATSAPYTQTVPGTSTSAPVVPDKGTVSIRAKVVTSRGATQPARSAKFYLLDKDIETILNEARVEPIEGNSIQSSLGLAAVHPDQYGEFQRAAMRAIAAHAKYSGTTGSDGSAKLGNIAPKEYYLFAITRVGNGFAIWNSPVSVNPGDNLLDLSPASVTEIEG